MATGIKKISLKSGKVKFQIRPYTGKMITTKKGNLIREQGLERYDTRKEADRRLREIKGQVEKKSFTPKKKIPTINNACDAYFENKKNTAKKDGGTRSTSTISYYDVLIRIHIKPVIGNYKMNDVDKTIAENARNQWCKSAPDSVDKILMVIRAIYEENSEMIPKNPFKNIGPAPRTDARTKEERTKVDPRKVYGRAEVETLLANAVTERDYLMLRITGETALRDGEILGLAQEFVVPNGKRIIQVRYQWRCRKEDYNNGVPVLQRLKTPQSVRDVKISSALAAELIAWKQANAKNPLVHTWDGEQVQLMFVSEANRPCTRNNLRKAMIRAIKHAHESDNKLRSLDFYSLRHHRASIWIEEGLKKGLMSDLEIAAMMGHKNSTITREVYAAYLESESTFDADDLEKPIAVRQQPEAAQEQKFLQ